MTNDWSMEDVERFPKATDAIEMLLNMPAKLNDSAMTTIKQFMVLLHEWTSDILQVNDSRIYHFTRKKEAWKTCHQFW